MKSKFLLLFLSLFMVVGGVKAQTVTFAGTNYSVQDGKNLDTAPNKVLAVGNYTLSVSEGWVITGFDVSFKFNQSIVKGTFASTPGSITVTMEIDGESKSIKANRGTATGWQQYPYSSDATETVSKKNIEKNSVAVTISANNSNSKGVFVTNIKVAVKHVAHEYENGFCKKCQKANPDGLFLYNVETGKFLSRGNQYGTAGVVDEFGIPVTLESANNGGYYIKYLDNNLFLSDEYWLWADGDDDRKTSFVPEATSNGVHMVSTRRQEDNCLYAYTMENGDKYRVAGNAEVREDGNCPNENQRVWRFVTLEERNQILAANLRSAEESIAQAAGITLSDNQTLSSVFANVQPENVTDKISNATLATNVDGWNWTRIDGWGDLNVQFGNGVAELYQTVGTLTQEVTDLKEGIYRLSVNASFRQGGTNECVANSANGMSTAYLKVGDNIIQIKDWASGRVANDNPDNLEELASCFANNSYVNTMYVYVGEDGKLPIELGTKNKLGGCWLGFNNFKLEYYQPTAANLSCKAGKYGTFCAPFEVELPENVTAWTVEEVKESWITLAGLEEEGVVPANTPVILKNTGSSNASEAYYGYDIDKSKHATSGVLVGVYPENQDVLPGAYLLQTQGDVQQFFLLGGTEPYTCPLNRCYLNVAGGSVKAFSMGSDETAIGAIEALTSGEAKIYDLNGRRLSSLQKGVNIVNGKKVMVK